MADPGANGIMKRTALNTTATATAADVTALVPLSKDFSLDAPSTVDTNKHQISFPLAVTINRVHCSTDIGTVSINLDVRAIATPNTAGADVLSAVLVCDNDTQSSCAAGCDVNTITAGAAAAHLPVNLQITATASNPNVVRIHVEAQ